MNETQRVLLVIMDGYGLCDEQYGNAIKAAHTPNLDTLFSSYPNTYLEADGNAVGLPQGQMGNSEVGHTNIGAGRIVYQELTRITRAVDDGTFFENEALKWAMASAKEKGGALHLMGLLSDGGVHSHNTHLYALLRLAKASSLDNVYVHCFLDGRDTSPTSGLSYINELEEVMADIGIGRIATVSGRYYGMDRDNRYERVKLAYDAIADACGERATLAGEYVASSYKDGISDEFVIPCVIGPERPMSSDDSVIFFNFRPDRARQITRAFVDADFNGFPRDRFISPSFVSMTDYDKTIKNVRVAFPPQTLNNTLGEYISSLGLSQLRIAETEKYAHVTFFFNGGVETPYPGEDRVLIPSPKVATYDMMPQMSAHSVTEECIARMRQKRYDMIVLNYANCDMVGHTGIFDAAVSAVCHVDDCVGALVGEGTKQGYVCVITADHGNSDRMYDDDGSSFTAHTTNPVPFVVTKPGISLIPGRLCDVAPTMLDIMGLEKPREMTGQTLIKKP